MRGFLSTLMRSAFSAHCRRPRRHALLCRRGMPASAAGYVRERFVQGGEAEKHLVKPCDGEDAQDPGTGCDEQHVATHGPGPVTRPHQGVEPGCVAELRP